MILLAIVFAPLSLTGLLIVMSWAERALDRRLTRQVTPVSRAAAQ